jgi:hypothetical protein
MAINIPLPHFEASEGQYGKANSAIFTLDDMKAEMSENSNRRHRDHS